MLTLADNLDPLGILTTTRTVVENAKSVQIDLPALERLVRQILEREFTPPEWESDLHWHGTPEATANYVLVLDALNFSFWGEPRWVIAYQGKRLNGYYALAAALSRALDQRIPLTDADFLAGIEEQTLANILAGEHTIPLLPQRVSNLREVGHLLRTRYDGQFAQMIRRANGSAIALVGHVVDELPSFRDESAYAGNTVRFYKRAQILASDLAGAFGGVGPGNFSDLDQLTAFADYKVPQVLQHLGVLRYDAHLTHLLERRTEIPASDPQEVEIRAATIWAVEALRQTLAARGTSFAPYQLDWMLWQLGQHLPDDVLPYHRTRTIYY